jgi:hypothetical protein
MALIMGANIKVNFGGQVKTGGFGFLAPKKYILLIINELLNKIPEKVATRKTTICNPLSFVIQSLLYMYFT